MPSTDTYRAALRDLPAAEWDAYLLAHANLPGPRGNLELAAAAADLGDEAQFRRWAALGPDAAPENTPDCFLAFCGVVGLGQSLSRPDRSSETCQVLRALASDPRWRIREAVAMALQRWGDADMPGLLAEMADWATGSPLEQRAAAAGLCEPRLLKNPDHAAAVLRILDEITASIPLLARSETGQRKSGETGQRKSGETGQSKSGETGQRKSGETGQRKSGEIGQSKSGETGQRKSGETGQSKSGETGQSGRDALKTLRQGLGYCWSVAVVALPDAGKPLMEKWLACDDPDIRWIMRENLKKNRLAKMDAGWVAVWVGKTGNTRNERI